MLNIFLYFCFFFTVLVNAEFYVADHEYALMPDLFFMDNFDQCMLRRDALFCTFAYRIKFLDENTALRNLIKNVSDNPQNYRHDILRHGICVPNLCPPNNKTQNSTKDLIQNCYNSKFSEFGFEGQITDLNCETNFSKYKVDIYDKTLGAMLLGYIGLTIIASIYEGVARYKDKKAYYQSCQIGVGLYLSAFSIPKNWYRLRTINNDPHVKKLRSIQGMRFYTMICVIMTHTLMTFFGGPVSNPQYSEQSTKDILNMFLVNGWFAIQTFFVISGWLLSFNFFKMLERHSRVNMKFIFFAIINRYFRLSPAVAVMAVIHSTWLIHLARGPFWDFFVGEEYRNCRRNWWTNLLYINNYIYSDEMCMQQTWYIASDMQLFIVFLILLALGRLYPSKFKYMLGFTLTVGLMLPGILAYIKKYDIIVRQYPENMYKLRALHAEEWHVLYSSAYSNIFGYGLGVTFGYFFYRHRNKNFTIRKVHVVLWWILTFGMCIFVILIAAVFYNPEYKFSPTGSAFYWSLGKNLFALGIAIGILGHTQKIGWFARWFCEWQPIQILGRLTYSTYIVHVAFAKMNLGYRRYPVSLNTNILFTAVLGDVTLAYLAGTLMCLLVELPTSALQKILFSAGNGQESNTKPKNFIAALPYECRDHQECTKV
ncbi:nose resistant to fluoxetine protein 6-like isoform X2 [Cylas formicarius]|uniref:nose resistant to fluoxetine protein 6-like isoform X2 n=1 Tax=Cylas formicarius TaxID=197179 RepID=UPI0029586DAD|nr:nose resistant to fluoxetine protein 6-like isoform X2 [Cylas formicarius]